MRIGGVEIKMPGEGWVTIPRPEGDCMRLKVHAYPLGFDIDDDYPKPTPPRIKARRTSGHVEREENNQPVWELDYKNKNYKAQSEDVFKLRQGCMFAHAVVFGDGEGEVAVDVDMKAKDANAYRGLYVELGRAGWSDGDINLVVNRAMEFSNLTVDAIEASRADFTPEEKSSEESSE